MADITLLLMSHSFIALTMLQFNLNFTVNSAVLQGSILGLTLSYYALMAFLMLSVILLSIS